MSRPEITEPQLKAQFDEYNRLFFKSALPEIPLFVSKRKRLVKGTSFQLLGRFYHPIRTKKLRVVNVQNGLIEVNTHISDLPATWKGTLLHEMIHAWMWFTCQGEDEESVFEVDTSNHGKTFTQQCNRIGKRLGLPEITEEGAANWPDIVFV